MLRSYCTVLVVAAVLFFRPQHLGSFGVIKKTLRVRQVEKSVSIDVRRIDPIILSSAKRLSLPIYLLIYRRTRGGLKEVLM